MGTKLLPLRREPDAPEKKRKAVWFSSCSWLRPSPSWSGTSSFAESALQGAQNLVVAPGRIAGDEATVSAKIAGRVREIRVREGDVVRGGDVIAILDDDQVRAREDAAKSAVQQAEARVRSSQQQISVLRAQEQGSSLSVDQSKIDAEGRVSQARAQVAAAEAALAQARAANNQAKYDYENQSQLAKDGDLSERQGMLAKSNLEATRAGVNAAEEQVKAARGAYNAQLAALKTPAILSSQRLSVEEQINKAQSDIAGAMADAEKARAQLREGSRSSRFADKVAFRRNHNG